MTDPIETALFLRWCRLALDGLGRAREEIDTLNVYPVPDSDTGTNLYLTFEAARNAALEADATSLVDALSVFARGALLGARGNSGVIVSQLLRAGAQQLLRGNPLEPGRLLADTLTLAADAAYDAVARPVEGTILTVARAASDAAQASLDDLPSESGAQMAHVIRAAAAAARTALAHTPDQLETLRLAGVVDAGGRGLCVILDAAEEALTGRRPPGAAAPGPDDRHEPVGGFAAGTERGPSYEVMFLLDADDTQAHSLKAALAPLGDSLVVVGGDGLWHVHIHVDDIGAAIEAAIAAGRPHRVRVTSLDEQLADRSSCKPGDIPPTAARPSPDQVGNDAAARRRGIVAVAAGEGLAALFADAGAEVVRSGPGRRCSTGGIIAAIGATGSRAVIILPNDSETLLVAEAAASVARDSGVRVAVIPSRAQVQGLAAIAVHDASRTFDDDVVQMTSAAGHARHGAVTVAARDAMTMAGPCREGDILGIVESDFAVVGDDLLRTAIVVVDRMLDGGGEMVTLVSGAEAEPQLALRVRAYVDATRPSVDVVHYDGGQPRYALLIGVE